MQNCNRLAGNLTLSALHCVLLLLNCSQIQTLKKLLTIKLSNYHADCQSPPTKVCEIGRIRSLLFLTCWQTDLLPTQFGVVLSTLSHFASFPTRFTTLHPKLTVMWIVICLFGRIIIISRFRSFLKSELNIRGVRFWPKFWPRNRFVERTFFPEFIAFRLTTPNDQNQLPELKLPIWRTSL